MPLLNYTTAVPAVRTVTQMMAMLAKHGAKQILNEYDLGIVVGLSFAIQGPHGVMRYRLPINIAAVEKVLNGDRAVPPRYRTAEQAERVAWRIMKDWLEAQLAIVQTTMVTLDQVMFPYMIASGGDTVYEVWTQGQLALETGAEHG